MTQKLQIIILTRLLKLIFGVDCYHVLADFVKFFYQLRKKSGISYAIKYFKAVRLHCTRYMCGVPLMVSEFRISLTDGFPTRFLSLKKLIDQGHFRIVLTILSWTRSIKPNKRELKGLGASFETITDPSKANRHYIIPSWFMREFCERFDLYSKR
jgi:hypothetical protein